MNFEGLIGNEAVKRRLQKLLEQERVAGAYLFCGPEGVGKFLFARDFAQALNCAQGPRRACGSCSGCARIAAGKHPDVLEIDRADEEIKIEDIRAMQQQISLRPYEGHLKVCIIRNAHMLNTHSASALLKTLEEPTRHTVLILVTEKPQLLMKTIISRSKQVRFASLSREALSSHLRAAHGVSDEEAHFLSSFCEGRIGEALRMGGGMLQEKRAVIERFCTGGPAARQEFAADFSRADLSVILRIAATWFRDVYCAKMGLSDRQLIHRDQSREIVRQSSVYGVEELQGILGFIAEASGYARHHVNAKLVAANLRSLLKG